MNLDLKLKGINFTLYELSVYSCTFLACLVPRYLHVFKINNALSMYSVIVIVVWAIFSRKVRLAHDIGTIYHYALLFLVIIYNLKGVENWRTGGEFFSWTLIAILFRQIILLRPRQRTFEIIILAITHALFIQLMVGLYEVFSHRYLFETGKVAKRLYGEAAISMFYNLNDYATFVASLVPLAIYRIPKNNTLFFKAVHVFFVFAAIYLIVQSESRGGYLSLIMLGGTMLFLYYKKQSAAIKRKAICLGVIGALLFISNPMLNNSVEPVITAVDSVHEHSQHSNLIRINLIKNGLHFLEMTNGLGVGAGNLRHYFEHYSIYDIEDIRYMHNWYMEILATFGIPFFILYLSFHISIIMKLLKACDKTKGFGNLNNAMLTSFMSFSVVSVSSSSNFYSEWVWMYFAVLSVYVRFRCA